MWLLLGEVLAIAFEEGVDQAFLPLRAGVATVNPRISLPNYPVNLKGMSVVDVGAIDRLSHSLQVCSRGTLDVLAHLAQGLLHGLPVSMPSAIDDGLVGSQVC